MTAASLKPSTGAVRWGILLVLVAAACLAVLLTLPEISHGPAPPYLFCRQNLDFIGIALRQYHELHGCLPPPYIAGEDGEPRHSWRVLLLPYLSEQPLYAAYNFDEPWDGPTNRLLASQIP